MLPEPTAVVLVGGASFARRRFLFFSLPHAHSNNKKIAPVYNRTGLSMGRFPVQSILCLNTSKRNSKDDSGAIEISEGMEFLSHIRRLPLLAVLRSTNGLVGAGVEASGIDLIGATHSQRDHVSNLPLCRF